MRKKKFLFYILMLALTLYCTVVMAEKEAAQAAYTDYPVNETVVTDTQLSSAISNAPVNGVSTNTPYVIEIGDNINVPPLTIAAGKNIIIRSAGSNPFTLTLASGSNIFTTNGSLTIADIVLNGGAIGRSITINSGGFLTMEDGTLIQNGKVSAICGGGIYVNGGTFIMNGGVISGNTGSFDSGLISGGGGVFVYYGTFTMNGGKINGNTMTGSGAYGGGLAVHGGTFTMNNGEISSNTGGSGGGIYFYNAAFTMNNGKINNNVTTAHSTAGGGGVRLTDLNCTFTMNGGEIKGNTSNGAGAGVYTRGTFIMEDGEISNNSMASTAIGGAGGINAEGGSFTMNGGVIKNNSTKTYGGGVILFSGVSFIMNDGKIIDNTAGWDGGGVNIYSTNTSFTMNNGTISGNKSTSTTTAGGGGGIFANGTFTMKGGILSNNEATSKQGGGIYVSASGTVNISNGARITGNKAAGNGGGIYTASASYSNVVTESTSVFYNNKASAAYKPPADAKTLYPEIGFASASIFDHPINNYDINYTTGTPYAATYRVTYDANSGNGGSHTGPYIPAGGTDIVLSPAETGISSAENHYTFTGWNTEAEGGGTPYAPGDDIVLNSDVTLFAQWGVNEYTVTFESDGGTPVPPVTGVPHGSTISKPANPAKDGFDFEGWYTDYDTFENEWNFEVDRVERNITLYAKWILSPVETEPIETEPIETEEIVITSKPNEASGPSEKIPHISPETGDDDMILWFGCVFVSLGASVFLIAIRKKDSAN